MERSPDRARRHTAPSVLRRIDDDTVNHLMEVAAKPETTSRRLEALDREWDIDRTSEAEAATMGLIGLALATFVRPAFLAVPATVGVAVFVFGTRSMYPLLPIFRRLGIRTAREIQRERHALKALRGDFDALPDGAVASRPDAPAAERITSAPLPRGRSGRDPPSTLPKSPGGEPSW